MAKRYGEKDSVAWKVCDNTGKPVLWTRTLTTDESLIGKPMDSFNGYKDAGHYAKKLNASRQFTIQAVGINRTGVSHVFAQRV